MRLSQIDCRNSLRGCKKKFKNKAAMKAHYRSGVCEYWRRTEYFGNVKVHFWHHKDGWTAERCFGGGWEGSDHERLCGRWLNLTQARKEIQQRYASI